MSSAKDRKFYASANWRKLRAVKLSDNPLCEQCEKLGIAEPATEVDHIKQRKYFPELAFDYDNLQSLCRTCHGRKSAEESFYIVKATKNVVNHSIKKKVLEMYKGGQRRKKY